ncbi:alpha-2-macroglobulin-like protein 1 [Pygocentrus nattereri]|uniref:alpha-2-macroglobulin-like protein 1 n=1 Tax=Pygocentrus nattereri TaxID=42514 RepID=UPI0018915ED8|nr:alpha-2-macroglobulin-like protein 1 [Pygocentrus nattereri]
MMVPSLIAAMLLLLHSAAADLSDEPIYMLAVTSQPLGGTTERLCINVYPLRKPLSLMVTLEHNQNSRMLLKQDAIKNNFFQCLPFKVPDVSIESEASINVQVSEGSKFLNDTTWILIRPPTLLTVIQTDKPIYKPGQTVRFRIVSLDTSFLTYEQNFPTIELKDPNSNRIGQWLNQSTVSGFLDLSYPMNAEAEQGSYIITAWNTKDQATSQDFEIREYVLPKFEVIVSLPPVVTVLDKQASLKICANYTYGKPVSGSVKAEVCRKHFIFWWIRPQINQTNLDICKTYSMTTDKTGCGSTVLNLLEFAVTETQYEDVISVNCEVEESGTGVVLKGFGSMTVTSNIVTITFVDAPQAFKLGMNYRGKVSVTGPDSTPVTGAPVFLTVKYRDNKNVTWTLITDVNGTAPFSLNTLLWGSESVSLEASYQKVQEPYESTDNVRPPYYPTAYLWVQPFYSKSQSFLELQPSSDAFSCAKPAVVEAQYIIQGKGFEPDQWSLDFFYMVMSKGSLAQYGRLSVTMKSGSENKGKLTFLLQKIDALAPYAQVVVYTVLPSGEAVADSRDFPIQLCLTNKVSLTFPTPTELPGGQTSLILIAEPRSLCSVKAIDRSVLLLKPENELNLDFVFNLLPVQRLSGYPYTISDEDPNPCYRKPPIFLLSSASYPLPVLDAVPPQLEPRSKHRFLPVVNRNVDVYDVFKDIGVKILTNAEIKKPVNCNDPIFYPMMEGPMLFAREGVAFAAMDPERENKIESDGGSGSEAVHTVRKFFPETWVWDLVQVGPSGIMGVKKSVPDSITSWTAGAFCTSSVGFGVAPKVELIAFQPFFVSLTLPYSIIRGEIFVLKASVFNYLKSCVMVKVTLANSEQFTAQQCMGCQYTRCLCAEESWTFLWRIQPTVLGTVSFNVSAEALTTTALCDNKPATVPDKGRIDTVVQTLLVEAEGTKQFNSYNGLLCPTGVAVETTISLKLPAVIVAGSATASVSVLGDLMGRALSNIDRLLAMPYGCGEQNMLLFAPNIYILLYLQSSGQLTTEIRNKAETFLVSGYQRELSYKHYDGSYSAFGNSDPSGNTWLTAFVMKSFASAKQFIFIDQLYVDQAKTWLGQQQQYSGSFASVGQLFHSDMKGGVNDEVTLTAYITAALLELGTPLTDPMVQNGLNFLRNAFTQLNSIYATALLSYTFTLAGDQYMRIRALTILNSQAIVEAGGRHWRRESHLNVLDSLEVEMTSYVLLALLSGPVLQTFDMSYSASIARWLAQQQNAFGGFASTQDTVVALQALAKYSAATYLLTGTVVVTVTGPSPPKIFTVSQSNRLLLQESSLQVVPGDYTVKAEGKGCVFAQFYVRYNIPPPADFSSFSISANTAGNCSIPIPSVSLSVTVSYNGKRPQTNMVIIEVKLLLGFQLDKESLKPSSDKINSNEGTVKRVDQNEGTVIIYLDGLQKGDSKTYTLVILRETVVQNQKPAVVKVYDYYETSDVAVADYNSPCK